VFAFLGSVRSALIPTIAIPLSLVGTFTVMLALGYSINLLTLLALVLGIGLVVDDAIIVVENVNRHLAAGPAPIAAAIVAGRELGGPIIAMTVVLVAVYVPIGFQSGLTGALLPSSRSAGRRYGLRRDRLDAVADDELAAAHGRGP
jgi:multidrug efflux pump